MRIKKRRETEAVEGDMTPMIDMVFQLLAFFMVLINFSKVEQDQQITLPASELAQPPEQAYDEPRTIQVTRDETILFGGKELTIDALPNALKSEAQFVKVYEDASLAEVTIIIRADASVKTGFVQKIIQFCQEAEFETFALRGKQADRNANTLRIN